ncbi:MAG: hypothetical protein ACOC9W_00880 [Persicimonas sp.]
MNERQIRQVCEDSGLSVARLEEAGEVLVVVPHSLDELPDAAGLDALGLELRELSGKRYVTLAIDGVDPS